MAAAANNPSSAVSNSFRLKLIINTTEKKVLFAEAGKDFVDFLFNLSTMPVGAIFRILKDHPSPPPGCVRPLSTSIENMDRKCFQNSQSKDYLLTKLRGETHVTKVPLLPTDDVSPILRTIYCCKSHQPSFSCYTGSTLTNKWCLEADFVRGALRYLVMDDLSVRHFEYSTMSVVSILTNEFNVRDFSLIEEKVVEVGANEVGLELLRAFMHTKSALTTVLLQMKAAS